MKISTLTNVSGAYLSAYSNNFVATSRSQSSLIDELSCMTLVQKKYNQLWRMSVSMHVSDSCRLIWSSTFVSTFHDDDDDDDGNSWPVGSFGRCLGQRRKSYSHWRKMMLKWSADLEWWELFGAINAMASDSTVYSRPISSKIIRENSPGWNSLPDSVISAPSLSTFRQRLKTFLFQASFPDIITDPQ